VEIAEFRSSRNAVETAHGRIAYVDVGKGPVALFVHGVFLNSFLWRKVIAEVRGERRCLAIDLPAHGETQIAPSQDLGLPFQAEVLQGFCEALGLKDVDLVANDTGGAVAQVFAARWPERVRTLTLTNCDAHDNLPPEAFYAGRDAAARGDLAPIVLEMARDFDLARGEGGFGVGYEHPERLSDEEVEVFVERFGTIEEAREVERFINCIDAQDLLAVEPQLKQLTAPTLVVWGNADVFFEPSWAYWLRDTIPGVTEVVEIEGGKLFFPDERAEEFAPHLLRHWAAHAPELSSVGR
jgi:pimeloyl-ACP methyl ester carboxylesterase